MNSQVIELKNSPASRLRTRISSAAAILLLPVGMALAVQPALAQAAPANPPTTAPAPEAPAPPTANGTTSASPSLAQQAQQLQQQAITPQQPFYVPLPHSRAPFAQYRPSTAPELDLNNSPRLHSLIRDGKLYISLHDAIALAIENNLDIAYFRYNFPIAQTDILRTKSGGFANGVDTSIIQYTQGGFGSSSGGGGGGNGGSGFSAGNGGIVTSTLGAGTTVPSFDPFLTFTGYVDHTVTQEANEFQVGVPVLKTNTIQGLANYSQSFPLGTNVFAQYLGQRITSNSPYNGINPELYSSFLVQITQPLLRALASRPTSGKSASPSATPRSTTLRSGCRSSPPLLRFRISTGIS